MLLYAAPRCRPHGSMRGWRPYRSPAWDDIPEEPGLHSPGGRPTRPLLRRSERERDSGSAGDEGSHRPDWNRRTPGDRGADPLGVDARPVRGTALVLSHNPRRSRGCRPMEFRPHWGGWARAHQLFRLHELGPEDRALRESRLPE